MKHTEKAARGQTIRQDIGVDRSSDDQVSAKQSVMGKKMGGGMKDVSHSISGTSSSFGYNDAPESNGKGR